MRLTLFLFRASGSIDGANDDAMDNRSIKELKIEWLTHTYLRHHLTLRQEEEEEEEEEKQQQQVGMSRLMMLCDDVTTLAHKQQHTIRLETQSVSFSFVTWRRRRNASFSRFSGLNYVRE